MARSFFTRSLTRANVTEVARRTAVRVERILRANGRSLDPQMEAGALSVDEPTLALHYAAAAQGISVAGERAGKPTLRLVVSQETSAKATTAARLAYSTIATFRRLIVLRAFRR